MGLQVRDGGGLEEPDTMLPFPHPQRKNGARRPGCRTTATETPAPPALPGAPILGPPQSSETWPSVLNGAGGGLCELATARYACSPVSTRRIYRCATSHATCDQ